MRDQGPRPPPLPYVDYSLDLADFVREYPEWVVRWGPHRGWPCSYWHLVIGVRALRRANARRDLRAYQTATMTKIGVEANDRQAWLDTMKQVAGW